MTRDEWRSLSPESRHRLNVAAEELDAAQVELFAERGQAAETLRETIARAQVLERAALMRGAKAALEAVWRTAEREDFDWRYIGRELKDSTFLAGLEEEFSDTHADSGDRPSQEM